MKYVSLFFALVGVFVWAYNLSQENSRWNRNWFLASVGITFYIICYIAFKKD